MSTMNFPAKATITGLLPKDPNNADQPFAMAWAKIEPSPQMPSMGTRFVTIGSGELVLRGWMDGSIDEIAIEELGTVKVGTVFEVSISVPESK